jgi:hypothetical protein
MKQVFCYQVGCKQPAIHFYSYTYRDKTKAPLFAKCSVHRHTNDHRIQEIPKDEYLTQELLES